MHFKEWPYFLPIVKSVLIKSASSQRSNLSPVVEFMVLKKSPPIATFLRVITTQPIKLSEQGKYLNIYTLKQYVASLRQTTLQKLPVMKIVITRLEEVYQSLWKDISFLSPTNNSMSIKTSTTVASTKARYEGVV